MKNKIYFLLLLGISLLLINRADVKAQSFTSANPHDSLLFDGSGNSFIRNSDDKCGIKVLTAIGKCIGTYYVDSIGEVCGLKDTIRLTRTGQLHKGYILVPGTEVTTGPNDDVTNESYNIVSLTGVGANRGEGIFLGSQSFLGKVVIGKDCVFHVVSGNVSVVGAMDISSSRSKVSHKNTQYTLEVIPDGDKFTDVVKVYEGSVTFSVNTSDGSYGKNMGDKGKQLKKLTEDFQNGKITAQEYSDKVKELQKDLEANTKLEVTVDAGFKSSITDGGVPTDPEAFDTNADRWWENK